MLEAEFPGSGFGIPLMSEMSIKRDWYLVVVFFLIFIIFDCAASFCYLLVFCSCGRQGLLFVAACRLLIVVESLFAERGFWGVWAQ